MEMKVLFGREKTWSEALKKLKFLKYLKESCEHIEKQLVEMQLSKMKLNGSYLDGNEPDVETLRKLIRSGCLSMSFVPVLGGSAFKNKGVQPLLNAVIDYLPSPLDIGEIKGTKPGTEEEIVRKFKDRALFCIGF